jgi:hypothetical protein
MHSRDVDVVRDTAETAELGGAVRSDESFVVGLVEAGVARACSPCKIRPRRASSCFPPPTRRSRRASAALAARPVPPVPRWRAFSSVAWSIRGRRRSTRPAEFLSGAPDADLRHGRASAPSGAPGVVRRHGWCRAPDGSGPSQALASSDGAAVAITGGRDIAYGLRRAGDGRPVHMQAVMTLGGKGVQVSQESLVIVGRRARRPRRGLGTQFWLG